MSQQQRAEIDQMLRSTWGDSLTAPHGSRVLDLGGDVDVQRRLFAEMVSAIPLPEDVHAQAGTLGEASVTTITVDGVEPSGTILHFHGGAYALGSAGQSPLASELARRSGTRTVSVDYPLAPEHPYPAAVRTAVAAYRGLLDAGVRAGDIVLSGESSGGGLALVTILEAMSAGLPGPAAAYVASPWADLTLTGSSITTKADADPSVTGAGLRRRARDYAPGQDLTDGRISPVFADLSGFPPLLIQVGGNEVLLDDATRLAAKAASDGVLVMLEVTPDVPHVFQGFTGMLDEAGRALDHAGQFIREALARVHE